MVWIVSKSGNLSVKCHCSKRCMGDQWPLESRVRTKVGFFFHRKQFEKNFYYGPIKKEMIHTLMNRHFMCKGEEESVENTRVSNYELMSLS